ncbi:MAG: hypothetical protein D6788_00650, partial [Planctomycetota bacterium]
MNPAQVRRWRDDRGAVVKTVVWLLLIGPPAVAAGPPVETPRAYEIVAGTMLPLLPDPLRAAMTQRIDDLRRAATSLVASSGDARGNADEEAAHFVWLDAAAVQDGSDSRRHAARKFPRQREAAERLARRAGLTTTGTLPWTLLDDDRALTEAMKKGDPALVAARAGRLVHWVTDASLPMNTTRLRGNTRQDRQSGSGRTPDSVLTNRWRSRLHRELIERYAARLRFEVRVFPQRRLVVSDPREAVFALLLSSHEAAEQIRRWERAGRMGKSRGQRSLSVVLAADRLVNLIESRLEAAAVVSAALIESAWREAGSPPLVAGAVPSAPPEASKPSPRTALVGSRNSMVFHRADCPSARRIRPQNRIFFS